MDQKILIWDLETAGINAFNADLGYLVCFGYKWYGEKETHCITIADFPTFKDNPHDDRLLAYAAHEIMSKAQHLVAHYGDKFDRRFLEARLIKHNLPCIPMVRQLDTCKLARAKLKLSSNRLANLAKFLECDVLNMDKGNGWPNWWFGALRGDVDSIRQMGEYCKIDVLCLEDIYSKMRHLSYGASYPNLSIGSGEICCPSCGSEKKQGKGYYYTSSKSYKRYVCTECSRCYRDTTCIMKTITG